MSEESAQAIITQNFTFRSGFNCKRMHFSPLHRFQNLSMLPFLATAVRSMVCDCVTQPLARVWYVASLVHTPVWLGKELSRLAFSFFWSGKRELVALSAVIQSPLFVGFSVVDVRYKVWALLGQWMRRLASYPSDWYTFFSIWCHSAFGVSPSVVFSLPFSFDPRVLPPFYHSLVLAWRGLNGSFSASKN